MPQTRRPITVDTFLNRLEQTRPLNDADATIISDATNARIRAARFDPAEMTEVQRLEYTIDHFLAIKSDLVRSHQWTREMIKRQYHYYLVRACIKILEADIRAGRYKKGQLTWNMGADHLIVMKGWSVSADGTRSYKTGVGPKLAAGGGRRGWNAVFNEDCLISATSR